MTSLATQLTHRLLKTPLPGEAESLVVFEDFKACVSALDMQGFLDHVHLHFAGGARFARSRAPDNTARMVGFLLEEMDRRDLWTMAIPAVLTQEFRVFFGEVFAHQPANLTDLALATRPEFWQWVLSCGVDLREPVPAWVERPESGVSGQVTKAWVADTRAALKSQVELIRQGRVIPDVNTIRRWLVAGQDERLGALEQSGYPAGIALPFPEPSAPAWDPYHVALKLTGPLRQAVLREDKGFSFDAGVMARFDVATRLGLFHPALCPSFEQLLGVGWSTQKAARFSLASLDSALPPGALVRWWHHQNRPLPPADLFMELENHPLWRGGDADPGMGAMAWAVTNGLHPHRFDLTALCRVLAPTVNGEVSGKERQAQTAKALAALRAFRDFRTTCANTPALKVSKLQPHVLFPRLMTSAPLAVVGALLEMDVRIENAPALLYSMSFQNSSKDLGPRLEKVATRLVSQGSGALRQEDEFKKTPLHLVCWFRQMKAARILVEGGSPLTAKIREGHTPLHLLVENRGTLKGEDQEDFKKLLTAFQERGFDFSVRNDKGETPLLAACRRGSLGMVETMVEFLGEDHLKAQDAKGLDGLAILSRRTGPALKALGLHHSLPQAAPVTRTPARRL
jgi:hypothetical protein